MAHRSAPSLAAPPRAEPAGGTEPPEPGRPVPGDKPAPSGAPRRALRPGSAWWPYLLIAPTVLGALLLLGYPLVRNLVISFQHFGMGELIRGGASGAGLDNYRSVLSDPEFWEVVRRTVLWTAVNVVLIVGLGTLVALLLQGLGRRLRVVVLSGLVLAWASPVIATTTVFQWLFASRLGVVNWLLTRLGLNSFEDFSWFANGRATFVILVLLIVWQSVPFAAITLYSALLTIPAELVESARMDGAGPWRVFRSVTLPVLRPVFGLVVCLEIIWVFRCFAQIWALSKGGPDGATTTLPVYAYRIAQSLHRYDLGAAVSSITVLLLVAVLIVYLRSMFRQEAEL